MAAGTAGVAALLWGWMGPRVACLTACTALVIGTEGPFWATLNQVAGRHGGLAGGIMNFGSNVGGLISPVATPWLAARIGWAGALTVAAAMAAVAGALWMGVSAPAVSLTTTESSTASRTPAPAPEGP
jgi:MFS family permease